ncbi:P27 family phage terminase small subunit [Streptomyces mirabilis]|uniref:P27 family phage terminase small subunit n=1 Tax=Streptomyces mirabilis TaxID=68239 RepID=UPI0021C24AF9|nr:P27 family phage terminase small subunit [Streptomyces mirabilis]MCT9108314.1 P27 family phage terminase small subunit [Streptomyces mirabilis]
MFNEPDWAAEFGTDTQTTADASAAWQRMTADIDIPPSQRDAATTYCLSVARVAEAERQISRDGFVVTGANGGMVKHPAVTVINMYSAGIRALQNALGLNPYASARNKVMARNGREPYEDYGDAGPTDASTAALKLVAGLDG